MLPLHVLPPAVVAVLGVVLELLHLLGSQDRPALLLGNPSDHHRKIVGINGIAASAKALLVVGPVLLHDCGEEGLQPVSLLAADAQGGVKLRQDDLHNGAVPVIFALSKHSVIGLSLVLVENRL